VKELLVNNRIPWGQPAAGWETPGWAPLVDPGSYPLQTARPVGRWLWPTLAVGGFLAVVVQVLDHDDPTPGLSVTGLLTIALAAAVVVLLTIHRRYGPGSLARALVEYMVVAFLAGLLTATSAGVDQQPADHATSATPKAAATPKAEAAPGDDRPVVVRVGAKVVRAVTGTAGWLAELWRQASKQTDPAEGQAIAASPRSPTPYVLSLRRCL